MRIHPSSVNRGSTHVWNSLPPAVGKVLWQLTVAFIVALLPASRLCAITGGGSGGGSGGNSCGSCAGADHAEITFRASADLAANGSISIGINGLVMSADGLGAGTVATPPGLAVIPTETVMDGQVIVTNGVGVAADFVQSGGCGQTVEIRKKDPTQDPATSPYGPWSTNPHPCYTSQELGSAQIIKFQIRILRADAGAAVAPAAVTEMTPPAVSWVNRAWQNDPAAFTSRIPLGLTADTGRFNAGSLILTGPLSDRLAASNNLMLKSAFATLQSLTDPTTHILRQVMSPNRLADIIANPNNSGFEVRIYERGDFSPSLNQSGTHDINPNAHPSITYRYLKVQQGSGNLGGIRLETLHRDGSTEAQTYLNVTASEYLIITGDNLETRDLVSNLTQTNDGQWQRSDVETVSRDGVLFSKTQRNFLLQTVADSTASNKSVTPFMILEHSYIDANNFLETLIEPSPYPGLPATVTHPDGSWETRSYYDGTASTTQKSAWFRLPKQILRPWNNTPAAPPSNNSTANCQVTSLTYTDSPVDGSFQPASQNTTLPPASKILTTSPAVQPLIALLADAGLSANWLPAATDLTPITLADMAGSEPIPATTIRYQSHPAFGLTTPPLVPWAQRTFAMLDAEGNGTLTGYEPGSFNSATGSFTATTPANLATATHLRAITLTLRNFGLPASNESTLRVVIEDLSARALREELRLRDGTTWSLATVTTTTYDDAPASGLATMTRRHDGRVTSKVIQLSPFESIVIDEQGIKTTTLADVLHRPTSVTRDGCADQPSRTTTSTYSGRNSSTTTRAGNLTLSSNQTSDLLGRTTSQTDPTGATTTTAYPNHGRDTLVTMPGDNSLLTTHSIDGLPLSITGTAAVNESWTYSIDQGGNLLTTHRTGPATSTRLTTTATDPAGRATTVTSPSPAADTTLVTQTTGYASNTRRPAIRISSAPGTARLIIIQCSPDSSLVRSGLDANNDRILRLAGSDRIAETHNYFLNDGTLWWSVTQHQTYDTLNSATSVITSSSRERLNGNTGGTARASLQTLPGGGTILTETSLDPATKTRTTTTTRSGCSLPETIVNVNGLDVSQTSHQSALPTRRVFDALGRIFIETSPLGAITKTLWNNVGQIDSVTDHFNHPTRYTWWESNTVAAGRLKSLTNAKGQTTLHTWSARGELLSTTGTAQYPLTRTYDAYGDLETLTTWRAASTTGDTTTWQRDPASGVLLAKIYPDSSATRFTWYPSGKPATRTWQRGAVTTWSWNILGDLTAITYTGDNDLTPDVTITAYNRLGQPLTITQSGLGTENYTYHPGRATPATHTYDPAHTLLPGRGITWPAPDPNDLPAGYTPTDGPAVAYNWQDGLLHTLSAGSAEAIAAGTAETHTYDYLTNSALVYHITAAAGASNTFRQTYSHDIAGRLLGAASDSLSGGTHPLTRHGYQLDELSRRIQTTQLDGSTWTWGYTERGEVTSAIRKQPDGTAVPPLAASYTFDDVGNRKTSSSPILGNLSYTSNITNQYTSIVSNSTRSVLGSAPTGSPITVNGSGDNVLRIGSLFYKDLSANNSAAPQWLQAVISDGTQTQTRHCWLPALTTQPHFDADGNLDNDGQWTYTWDAENRLVKMETTLAAVTAARPYRKLTFVNDWCGHRLARKVEATSNPPLSDTRWLYDGWNPIAEYNQGGTATSPVLAKTYLWGLDLSGTLQGAGGVGGLLSVTDHSSPTSSPFFPSFDGNGNITAWTQSAATAPTCLREYDAFGNIVAEQGPAPCAFGFSTKLQDPETALLYYGLRYYHPPTGRWPSRDPIGEEGGMNLYGFVGNDGIGVVDCLGLWHGGTHQELTTRSFDAAIKQIPHWPTKCTRKVNDLIIARNLAQDKGAAFDDLRRHFNRKITDDPDKAQTGVDAKKDYKIYLASEVENFLNALDHVDPNSTQQFPASCSLAIGALGRLTHSWQDYYAHAIALQPGRRITATKKLWTGNPPISGSPDDLNPRIFPSSWGMGLGEHGAREPFGDEGDKRKEAAVSFVTTKLEGYLSYWAEKCACECDTISY